MGSHHSHHIERHLEENAITAHKVPLEELYEKYDVDPDVGHTFVGRLKYFCSIIIHHFVKQVNTT